jgi:HEAT repeat protein
LRTIEASHSRDDRLSAIDELTDLGSNDPRVTSTLLKAVRSDQDPAVRADAALALGMVGGDTSQTTPVLLNALSSDPDPNVRGAAALAAAQSDGSDSNVLSALLTTVKSETDPQARGQVACALSNIRGQVPVNVPIETLVALVIPVLQSNRDFEIRTIAAMALGQLSQDDENAIDPLVAALTADNDPRVQMAAAAALGEIGANKPSVVRALVSVLKPQTGYPELRAASAQALGQIASRNPEIWNDASVVSALLDATKTPNDMRLREVAVSVCGVTKPDPAILAALVDALQPANDPGLRASAAGALESIALRYPDFPSDPNLVNALVAAMSPNNDPRLRIVAAAALGPTDRRSQTALTPLLTALDRDSDRRVREAAAMSLGLSGAGANSITIIHSLTAGLNAGRCGASCVDAVSRLAAAATTSRSAQPEMIRALEEADRSIKATLQKDKSLDSPATRTALSYIEHSLESLQLTANQIWWAALGHTAQNHPWIVGGVSLYALLLLTCLFLLWRFPLLIFLANEGLRPYSEFKLPIVLGEISLPVSHLLVIGWFQYHDRVLDAWVGRYLPSARLRFDDVPTVNDRQVHVDAPVELNRRKIAALSPTELKTTFKRKQSCILIWGEGGAGKTSLACEIGKWAMSEDQAMWLHESPMLPVIVEPDSILGFENSRGLLDVTRGLLKHLTDEAEAPAEELVKRLLKRKRILLIIDGLSEFRTAAQKLIRPDDPDWPVNALVLTSRLEQRLAGPQWTVIKPLRIEGNRLSSFMDAYLFRRGKRELFDDIEFFNDCAKLSSIVAGRDATLLLAKLYAEQMIAGKEGFSTLNLPRSVPELMLEYLNNLNSKVNGDKPTDRTVHRMAKAVARECLLENYRPMPVPITRVLGSADGKGASETELKYLEEKLLLIQIVGPGRDRVRFTLDPLAEYMAALDLIENYGNDERRWQTFFAHAQGLPGFPDSVKGFLRAVQDCCTTVGRDSHGLTYAANELGRILGSSSFAA